MGLDNIGAAELLMLIAVALFVFGPERLPKAAADAGRMLRRVREMATGVREDLRSELGPEFGDVDLSSLHPRTFITRNLLGDDEDEPTKAATPRRPARPLEVGETPPYDVDTT